MTSLSIMHTLLKHICPHHLGFKLLATNPDPINLIEYKILGLEQCVRNSWKNKLDGQFQNFWSISKKIVKFVTTQNCWFRNLFEL